MARVEALAALPPRPSDPSRYVREYEGGDCFFIHPLNISSASASIEGFGSSPSAFEAFETAFKTTFGFEPDQPEADHRRAMSRGQFHEDDRRRPGRGPKLQIDAFNLKLGETQSGSVESLGGGTWTFCVADDGYVHNLSEYLARGCLGEVPPPARASAARDDRGLNWYSPSRARSASRFARQASRSPGTLFPLLLDEVRTGGAGVDLAVKYFRID